MLRTERGSTPAAPAQRGDRTGGQPAPAAPVSARRRMHAATSSGSSPSSSVKLMPSKVTSVSRMASSGIHSSTDGRELTVSSSVRLTDRPSASVTFSVMT